MQTFPVPASAAEAAARVLSDLKYLATTDPTALAVQVQAECLQAFKQADAISTAARAQFLAVFTAGQGYSADADYSPAAWLIHRTKVTRGAARDHLGWARRSITHPQVAAALAEGTVVSASVARVICGWTDKLPRHCQADADEILLAAAGEGPAAPRPPTAPAVTAARGWTATPPARWPATRRSPRSSPATSTRASWMTWSPCA